MQDSVFTKIIKGEMPGEVIYQDDQCFVPLTIQPLTEGHMMVIPRQQVDHLWDLDDEIYHHLFRVARQMQAKLKIAYPDYPRIGLLVEGFGVPHTHVHIFGYTQPMEETILEHKAWKEQRGSSFVDAEQLHMVAEKLRAA